MRSERSDEVRPHGRSAGEGGCAPAVRGRVLVAGGEASGPLLRLAAPLSFWGGVDPARGVVSDPRHPDHGRSVARTVLAVPASVGSSSSSAVMLELLRVGRAPAALLLGEADAIVALGVVVARELGLDAIPVIEVPWREMEALGEGRVRVDAAGGVTPLGG